MLITFQTPENRESAEIIYSMLAPSPRCEINANQIYVARYRATVFVTLRYRQESTGLRRRGRSSARAFHHGVTPSRPAVKTALAEWGCTGQYLAEVEEQRRHARQCTPLPFDEALWMVADIQGKSEDWDHEVGQDAREAKTVGGRRAARDTRRTGIHGSTRLSGGICVGGGAGTRRREASIGCERWGGGRAREGEGGGKDVDKTAALASMLVDSTSPPSPCRILSPRTPATRSCTRLPEIRARRAHEHIHHLPIPPRLGPKTARHPPLDLMVSVSASLYLPDPRVSIAAAVAARTHIRTSKQHSLAVSESPVQLAPALLYPVPALPLPRSLSDARICHCHASLVLVAKVRSRRPAERTRGRAVPALLRVREAKADVGEADVGECRWMQPNRPRGQVEAVYTKSVGGVVSSQRQTAICVPLPSLYSPPESTTSPLRLVRYHGHTHPTSARSLLDTKPRWRAVSASTSFVYVASSASAHGPAGAGEGCGAYSLTQLFLVNIIFTICGLSWGVRLDLHGVMVFSVAIPALWDIFHISHGLNPEETRSLLIEKEFSMTGFSNFSCMEAFTSRDRTWRINFRLLFDTASSFAEGSLSELWMPPASVKTYGERRVAERSWSMRSRPNLNVLSTVNLSRTEYAPNSVAMGLSVAPEFDCRESLIRSGFDSTQFRIWLIEHRGVGNGGWREEEDESRRDTGFNHSNTPRVLFPESVSAFLLCVGFATCVAVSRGVQRWMGDMGSDMEIWERAIAIRLQHDRKREGEKQKLKGWTTLAERQKEKSAEIKGYQLTGRQHGRGNEEGREMQEIGGAGKSTEARDREARTERKESSGSDQARVPLVKQTAKSTWRRKKDKEGSGKKNEGCEEEGKRRKGKQGEKATNLTHTEAQSLSAHVAQRIAPLANISTTAVTCVLARSERIEGHSNVSWRISHCGDVSSRATEKDQDALDMLNLELDSGREASPVQLRAERE
ncbi:hypothetical protein C8R45DRAFT_935316 [Mycena sanguinolenta]|nr:hypothetical protein C8R45DRAFT_935316 [Mycena sanguinolenta]